MSAATINHMLHRARERFESSKGAARIAAMKELHLALELAREVEGE